MKTKLFEVRDAMTFIVVMATKVKAENQQEVYLLGRVGYKSDDDVIVVTKLSSLETHDHWNKWSDTTMQTIHSHLEESFDELGFGSVLDAQFLRGESETPRHSERGTPIEIVDALGMTLKEFAQGMDEAAANTIFLENLEKKQFNSDEDLIEHLYQHAHKVLQPEHVLQWITAVFKKKIGAVRENEQFVRVTLAALGHQL